MRMDCLTVEAEAFRQSRQRPASALEHRSLLSLLLAEGSFRTDVNAGISDDRANRLSSDAMQPGKRRHSFALSIRLHHNLSGCWVEPPLSGWRG